MLRIRSAAQCCLGMERHGHSLRTNAGIQVEKALLLQPTLIGADGRPAGVTIQFLENTNWLVRNSKLRGVVRIGVFRQTDASISAFSALVFGVTSRC